MEQKKPHKPPAHYEKVIKRSTERLFKGKISHSASFMMIEKEKKGKKTHTQPQTTKPQASFHTCIFIHYWKNS